MVAWLNAGFSWTTPAFVVMWNVRFCQKRSLVICGTENFVQRCIAGTPASYPVGHVTLGLVNAARKFELCLSVAKPAGWGNDVVMEKPVQLGLAVGSHPGGA